MNRELTKREQQIVDKAKQREKETGFSDFVHRARGVNSAYGIGFLEGAAWSDNNSYWRDTDEELPIIEEDDEGEKQFLCLFWTENQEELFDDDDTKYDEEGLVLDIAYYYGDNVWMCSCLKNGYGYHKVYVKYWMPIPYRPEKK